MSGDHAGISELWKHRLLVVTGKGGVGKTSLAAAVARCAQSLGRRVLVVEVGARAGRPSPLHHALAGSTQPLPEQSPLEITRGLEAMLITPATGHRAFIKDHVPLGFLAERALQGELVQRFLLGVPAFTELGLLYRGLSLVEATRHGQPRWDLVVLDAPASGHAVAMATLPEVARKVFATGPVARALDAGLALLTDPSRTAAVLATLPEALPVAEAMELAENLKRSRIKVGAVVANRVPRDPFNPTEHAALALWQQTASQSPAGVSIVARLRQAKTGLARLEQTFPGLLTQLYEQQDVLEGPEMTQQLAGQLERL